MDLDTFLTTLYGVVDDWYQEEIGARVHVGVRERMSDSEVLTVALAGQWRVGVPWRSERGVVRWMQPTGRTAVEKLDRFEVKLKERGRQEPPSRTQQG